MPASAATALPPAGVISILIAPPARHVPMCLISSATHLPVAYNMSVSLLRIFIGRTRPTFPVSSPMPLFDWPSQAVMQRIEAGRSGRLRLIDCTRITSPEFPIDKQFMMVLFNVPQSRVCCKWLPHASNSQPDDSITTRRRTT